MSFLFRTYYLQLSCFLSFVGDNDLSPVNCLKCAYFLSFFLGSLEIHFIEGKHIEMESKLCKIQHINRK